MKRRRIQYTIRDVPPAVDRELRAAAKRAGKSFNRALLGALAKGAGLGESPVYTDLDGVIGSWIDDPDTERALAEQRTIDPELWK
ncbi:MAG: hypothetical protein HY553_07430 [Elusimicrobia bacterium]|nr:hypothetical protein [Elusimicrobiota bacterium]